MIFSAKNSPCSSKVKVPLYFCTMRRITFSSYCAERFACCSGGRSGLMMFTTTKPCRTQTSRSMTLHSGRETCTELSTA